MSVFMVNDVLYTVTENINLLRFLRDELHLTSVKDGCSEGACGTCTVLIDGKAQKACTQKAQSLDGKKIITTEGLSDREKEVYRTASPRLPAACLRSKSPSTLTPTAL